MNFFTIEILISCKLERLFRALSKDFIILLLLNRHKSHIYVAIFPNILIDTGLWPRTFPKSEYKSYKHVFQRIHTYLKTH